MNNTDAIKYIDGRMLELVLMHNLDMKDAQRKRIDEEAECLLYVRGLCERAEALDVTKYGKPIESKTTITIGGIDRVETLKFYPCPHCGKLVANNKDHRYCEWCGQALNFMQG